MKKSLILMMFFLLVSCGSRLNVKPQSELKELSARRILELAAGEYVNYNYDAALYYYKQLVELYPWDLEDTAWANYEMGFIQYKKHNYKEAVIYFDRVLSENSPVLVGAQVLAAKMKDEILRKTKKKSVKKEETKSLTTGGKAKGK